MQEIVFIFKADSFLQRMVRNMVGVLVKIGKEDFSPKEMNHILAKKRRDQVHIQPAPPQGLFLVNVHYPSVIPHVIESGVRL